MKGSISSKKYVLTNLHPLVLRNADLFIVRWQAQSTGLNWIKASYVCRENVRQIVLIKLGQSILPRSYEFKGTIFLYRMTFWRILDFHSFEILVKFLKPLCLSSASVRSSSCSGICSVRSFLHFGLSNAALPRVYYVISVQSLTSRDDVILALWESLRALVGFTFPVEFIKQAARE